jgi:Flp pilus assembly protein TadD
MKNYYQQGIDYLEVHKMKEAEEAFIKFVSENPDHAMGFNKLGLVYAKIEDYTRAKESFLKAVELDEKLVHAWNNLGNISRQEGDLEEARVYYQRAIEIEPGNPIPCRNLKAIEKQLKWTPRFLKMLKEKVNKNDRVRE